LDNTWATPLYCKAFALGVDVSVHSATKYILGHSDAMLGVITTTKDTYMRVKQAAALFGHHAAPEEIYLAQRGLRTLPVRLKQQAETAFSLMTWLSQRAEVAQILSPMWQKDTGFPLWQRDCTGGAGLFSFALQPHYTQQHCHAFIDALQLFGVGFSWGGYESLALPVNLQGIRATTEYPHTQRIRLSMGLENAIDLQHDLEKGFAALHALS
jgi:cystathionine beta-lyase